MTKTKDYAMQVSQQSLYKIEQEYLDLIYDIERQDGLITQEQDESLIINKYQLEKKSLSYLSVIKTKESFNLQIAEEIKRLQAMKKRNDNIVTRLKENLLIAVRTFGDFEVGFTRFGTRKSQTVEVLDVNQLPKKYKTIKVTEQANKKIIKEALQGGEEVTGCKIVNHQNLRIN